MLWVQGVLLLALLEYMIFGALVGRARARYGVRAPAVSGHPVFERYFRVHQNSLELLVAFAPALVMFAVLLDSAWAAGIGAVFVVARILYAIGYIRAPEQRGPGAMLSFIALFALILGGLFGVVRALASA